MSDIVMWAALALIMGKSMWAYYKDQYEEVAVAQRFAVILLLAHMVAK